MSRRDPAIAGSCVLLIALQVGQVAPLRYWWGLNLWLYFPAWVAVALGAAALALALPTVRMRLVAVVRRAIDAWPETRGAAVQAVVFAVVTAALFALRERESFGDSIFFHLRLASGHDFVFPEVGATFLMTAFGRTLGPLVGPTRAMQLGSCVMGGLFVLVLWRVARGLTPSRQRAAAAFALIVSGGATRVFAGHVEVYAYTLLAVVVYLWVLLERRAGRIHWAWPALALGAALWMHASTVLLAPSLLLAEPSGEPRGVAARLPRLVAQGACALAPLALFFGAYALIAPGMVTETGMRVLDILGLVEGPEAESWWIRFGGSASESGVRSGIDYVFLSAPHLKYLANAYWLVMPFALPAVLALAPRVGRDALRGRSGMLLASCIPLLIYSVLLRPFWGPFDWDLFVLAPFMLGVLAAHWLLRAPRPTLAPDVVAVIVAYQVLFVSGPFLAIGVSTPNMAGPFTQDRTERAVEPGRDPRAWLRPWL